MKIRATDFDDLFIFEPTVIGDERGYFMESYNYKTLLERGIDYQRGPGAININATAIVI